ncbi:MAG: extracellular solute-binding protein [Armatimonadota bacterium]|nr:extracellular solute-binding protein [Armatimonadota bacterium]
MRKTHIGVLHLRQRKLHSLLIIAVIILAVFALVGCQKKSKPKVIRLMVWTYIRPEAQAGDDAMDKEFERRHPGVKIRRLAMGAGQMSPQKLMTAIVGKVPPDIVNQDRFTIGDWASRGTFIPLNKLIERDKNDKFAIRKEDYYSACWNEAIYKGKVYGVPNSTDVRLLMYNKELFREAGLVDANGEIKPPRTWDELLDYAKKLTKYKKDGSFERIGFIPNFGNCWLYLYAWQNNSSPLDEFMSPDGRRCTLNNPHAIEALEYMVKVYDSFKGVEEISQFQSTFQPNELDPFLTGKVAMKIDVDAAMVNCARFNPDLDLGVAPAPVPRERLLHKGRFKNEDTFVTWSGGFSYAIPRGTRTVDLSWEYIKWMCSVEANEIMAKAQKEYNENNDRPYLPYMHANRKVNEDLYAKFAPKQKKFRDGMRIAMEMMNNSRFRPVTFVGQMLWDEHVLAFDKATRHVGGITPKQAMDEGTYKVQKELNKVYNRNKNPLINMTLLFGVLGLILLAMVFILVIKARQSGPVGKLMRGEALAGYLFASPWIIGFLVFTIGPIVASIIFSFCDYDVLHQARWVGLQNYREWLTDDWARLSKSFVNVAFLSAIGIPLGILTGLSIAMLLNAKIKGMSWYRTVYYLPSIVPAVAAAFLWMWIMNPKFGLLNGAWNATLTTWFGLKAPGWFASELWAKPALIVWGLWGAGGGMILWLAGLQGIPQQLYEAAEIDGANKWQKFRAVTLPMLSPYMFFNLIMGTIGALQMFDQVYLATGGGPADATIVPVLLLFNNGFTYFKMGYASALAWIIFAIILTLALIQIKIAPRWVHYESEKK